MRPREKPEEEIPLRGNPQVKSVAETSLLCGKPDGNVQGVSEEKLPFAQLGQGQAEGLNFVSEVVSQHGRLLW